MMLFGGHIQKSFTIAASSPFELELLRLIYLEAFLRFLVGDDGGPVVLAHVARGAL